MSKLTATLKEEALAMIPPTVYFFIALHIVALVRLLIAALAVPKLRALASACRTTQRRV